MRPALIEAQANASPSARARKDQGTTRNVEPEAVNEAIQQALPFFHGPPPSVAAVYRVCIERELLAPDQVAVTTFRRIVHAHELLRPASSEEWRIPTTIFP
jgi:hypothetical protein